MAVRTCMTGAPEPIRPPTQCKSRGRVGDPPSICRGWRKQKAKRLLLSCPRPRSDDSHPALARMNTADQCSARPARRQLSTCEVCRTTRKKARPAGAERVCVRRQGRTVCRPRRQGRRDPICGCSRQTIGPQRTAPQPARVARPPIQDRTVRQGRLRSRGHHKSPERGPPGRGQAGR
jgi:hypothetical protein